ncbi:hypothetical protein MJH12_12460 [bacterium]|nr:hypothetical protein [bacterium]
MKDVIDTLYNHDQEVLEVYEQWAESKRSIEELVNNQKDLNQKLEDARAKKKSIEMDMKAVELDLGTFEAELKKCEKQKLSVTNEKSLKLIEDKIAKVTDRKDEIEMLWLEKSENLDPQIKLIQVLEDEGRSKSVEKEREIPKMNEDLVQSQKDLKDLIEARLDLMDGLSETIASKYDKLRVKNLFQPVIFHMIESGCPKCGMHIRNVDFEMIRYHDEVVPCESCGTIIYWQ